jgi:hypothetical protein
MIQIYFDHANAIDKDNRDGQDGIRSERLIKTDYWATRFNVSTLQKVAVDAWRAHHLETGGKLNLHQYMKELIGSLLHNRFPGHTRQQRGQGARTHFEMPETEALMWTWDEPSGSETSEPVENLNLGRRRREAQSVQDSSDSGSNSEDDPDSECRHDIKPLATSGLGGHSLMCSYCGVLSCARWYCVQCSTDGQGHVASTRQVRAFCGLGNARGCQGLSLHIQTGGLSDIRAEQRRKQQASAKAKRGTKRGRK